MDDYNICKICGFVGKNSRGRNSHILRIHKETTIGDYYKKFYPRYCLICNKLIEFKGEKYLQYKFCSQECLSDAFSKRTPKNKDAKKYAEKELIEHLVFLHQKYGGFVTQSLVKKVGEYNFQIYHKYFGSFSKACKLANVPCIEKPAGLKADKLISTPLTILVDSREQQPYFFEDSVTGTMDVGDYSIKDCENCNVVIERKSLFDLKSTLSPKNGFDRFIREFERAREKGLYVVVLVDDSLENFFKIPNFRGKMSNKALFHNLKIIESKFADCCQFLFTGNRTTSAKLVFSLCAVDKKSLIGVDLQDLFNTNKLFNYLA